MLPGNEKSGRPKVRSLFCYLQTLLENILKEDYKEPLAKVWVDELQSHFECDFELE